MDTFITRDKTGTIIKIFETDTHPDHIGKSVTYVGEDIIKWVEMQKRSNST